MDSDALLSAMCVLPVISGIEAASVDCRHSLSFGSCGRDRPAKQNDLPRIFERGRNVIKRSFSG